MRTKADFKEKAQDRATEFYLWAKANKKKVPEFNKRMMGVGSNRIDVEAVGMLVTAGILKTTKRAGRVVWYSLANETEVKDLFETTEQINPYFKGLTSYRVSTGIAAMAGQIEDLRQYAIGGIRSYGN
jgi:hypothetical protein